MGAKRQNVIAIHTGVSADPGDDKFFVDGCRGALIVDMKVQTGTDVTATARELIDGGIDLGYDAQTANFTVGAIVTGYDFSGAGRNATGVIMNDTDGGADGTLHLKNVSGVFKDGMVLRDDNGTQGVAVVDGAPTPVKLIGGLWATVVANAVGIFRTDLLNPELVVTDGDRGHVHPREFHVEYAFNSITTANFSTEVAQEF